jgi:hypothetical protein
MANGHLRDRCELANLVELLEVEVRERGLCDCEIFLFTDNTTAEAVYWNGTSKLEWLFDLVLWLCLLEMRSDLIIHVIHVAGTRMKAQKARMGSRAETSRWGSCEAFLWRSVALFIKLPSNEVRR